MRITIIFLFSFVFLAIYNNILIAKEGYAMWGTFHNGFSEKPANISNACAIFAENPDWEKAIYEASVKWKQPVSVMLAMIYQESSFVANARPRDASGRLLSTAYGYSQALDGTWEHYQKANKIKGKKRDNFEHSVHFMGWYNSVSMDKNEVSPNRPDLLYLNYHEGWGGFADKSYMKKPDLVKISKKVYNNAINYHTQLSLCPPGSDKSTWTKGDSSKTHTPVINGPYKDWY